MENQNTYYTDIEIRESKNTAMSGYQKAFNEYADFLIEKHKRELKEQAEYYKEIILKKSK